MPRQPKMGERIDALEDTVNEMQTTLQALVQQMQQQSLIIGEMSKQLGKKKTPPVSESSAEESSHSESRLAGKKVKLPVFEGDDPVAWITRAEIYFDVQNTPDDMRVKLSRLSMEGSTIHWFNLLLETEDDLSWEKLKKALIARYGGRRLENPFEELSTLRQTRSVEEFVEAFELLSSQVGRLPEEQYLGYFMSGLKPQIRRRVRTLNPTTRMQMMRMAKDVEDELKEEDDDGERYYGKKHTGERLGQKDWAGLSQKNRSGSSVNPKEMNRTTNSGWTNRLKKRVQWVLTTIPRPRYYRPGRKRRTIVVWVRLNGGREFEAFTMTRWRKGGQKGYVSSAAVNTIPLCISVQKDRYGY